MPPSRRLDQSTEAAVFDPNIGVYTVPRPQRYLHRIQRFQAGDIPAPADYGGSGRPSRWCSGQVPDSSSGRGAIATFGQAGDIPLAAPLSYRTPARPPDRYDRDGYDRNRYNRDGYDRDGYDRDRHDRDRHNRDGHDRHRHDRDYQRYDRDW